MTEPTQVCIGSGLLVSHAVYEMLLALGEYHQTDPALILREQLRISADRCNRGEDPFPRVPADETDEQRARYFREQTLALRQRIRMRQTT